MLEGLRSINGGDSVLPLYFTALHPRAFGRTIRVWSTKSSKVRAENRVIRCLPFSQSVSTEHWRPQENGCSMNTSWLKFSHDQTRRRDLGPRWDTRIFVQEHLQAKTESHRILLDRIPSVPDLQTALRTSSRRHS